MSLNVVSRVSRLVITGSDGSTPIIELLDPVVYTTIGGKISFPHGLMVRPTLLVN